MTTMMNVVLIGTEHDYDAVSHNARRVAVPKAMALRKDVDEIARYAFNSGQTYCVPDVHTAMSAQDFRVEYGPQDIDFWVPDGVYTGRFPNGFPRTGFPYATLGMTLTAIGRDDNAGTIYDHSGDVDRDFGDW